VEEKESIDQLNRAVEEVMQLLTVLYALEEGGQYSDIRERLSLDAALQAEKITCRLRHLAYVSSGIEKQKYQLMAGNTQGIIIHMEGNIFEIDIPCLLPKRRNRKGVEFLLDPLYFTLNQYITTHSAPKYRECTVCFNHIYNEKGDAGIRDYDNIEQKQILDVLAAYLLTDDSGALCDVYHTTERGKKDGTQICIMDKQDFPKWLLERKKGHF